MEKENEIKETTAFLMIFTALFFDALQAVIGWIPIFGNLLAMGISLFAFMTFFLWFYVYGISMTTPKRLGGMIGGGIIEMIPYIDLIPAWTFVVIYLIGTTKIKEIVEKHPGLVNTAVKISEKIK